MTPQRMASERRSPSRMARIAPRLGDVVRPWFLPASLAVAVVGADLASKQWALAHLGAAGSTHSGLQSAVVTNRGAAWGLGSSAPLLVGVIEAFGVVLLGWRLLMRATRAERVWLAVVLGGATANLIERVGRGAVTDWIHVAPYPPYFNVADVAVRGGLIAWAVLVLVRRRRFISAIDAQAISLPQVDQSR